MRAGGSKSKFWPVLLTAERNNLEIRIAACQGSRPSYGKGPLPKQRRVQRNMTVWDASQMIRHATRITGV